MMVNLKIGENKVICQSHYFCTVLSLLRSGTKCALNCLRINIQGLDASNLLSFVS